MKIFKLLFLLILLSSSSLSAQKKEKQIITEIEFQTNKIILNKKHAFNYYKQGNHFAILDLDDKEIITGDITSLGEGKFSSIITFVEQKKIFSNAKIIGRNELFFNMAENNVITKKFEIDPVKLDEFFEKYNELK